METRVFQVDNSASKFGYIQEAAKILREGGIVAFPTETVYGLGADALNETAVQNVFRAKGRPTDNPLIIHIASMGQVSMYAKELPEKGRLLAEIFWPGPLTLILNGKEKIPKTVTAGLDTVALRVPSHSVTLRLLELFNGGIVGPSANTSGKPSPTTAEHVLHDLDGKIDLILDAGPTHIGLESTVVDVTVDPPVILRLGGLRKEDIEKEIGEVCRTHATDLLKRSPGTRHRHYAPSARVILVNGGNAAEFENQIHLLKKSSKIIGAITRSKNLKAIEATSLHINLDGSVEYYAKHLFRALRELDKLKVDAILVESVEEQGLGAAVMDRLKKASDASSEM